MVINYGRSAKRQIGLYGEWTLGMAWSYGRGAHRSPLRNTGGHPLSNPVTSIDRRPSDATEAVPISHTVRRDVLKLEKEEQIS